MAIQSLIDSLPYLMKGLLITIVLTLASIFVASIIGILMAMARSYGKQPLPFLVYIYEKVFRGIPLLVIFFIIYFGLSQIGINLTAFAAAVAGLAIHSTAYQIQIYRSAINSVPEGQMTAAMSLGMSKLKTIRYIIIPQVLRLSIPGWSNEFTIVLKDTSIAFSIGVIEIMRQGRYIYSRDPESTLYVLLFIALAYFILVFSANRGLSYLEKKYKLSGYEVASVR